MASGCRLEARTPSQPRAAGVSVSVTELLEAHIQSKLLHGDRGARTFATGDEAIRCLHEFAIKDHIGGAQVTAIGALSSARFASFDWEAKQYRPIARQSRLPRSSGTSPSARTGSPASMFMPFSGAEMERSGRPLAGGLRQADA